jgi:hypothetical protein
MIQSRIIVFHSFTIEHDSLQHNKIVDEQLKRSPVESVVNENSLQNPYRLKSGNNHMAVKGRILKLTTTSHVPLLGEEFFFKSHKEFKKMDC